MTVLKTKFHKSFVSLRHFVREEEMEEEMEEHYGTSIPEGITEHEAIFSLIHKYWNGDYIIQQEDVLLSTLVYKVKYPSKKK